MAGHEKSIIRDPVGGLEWDKYRTLRVEFHFLLREGLNLLATTSFLHHGTDGIQLDRGLPLVGPLHDSIDGGGRRRWPWRAGGEEGGQGRDQPAGPADSLGAPKRRLQVRGDGSWTARQGQGLVLLEQTLPFGPLRLCSLPQEAFPQHVHARPSRPVAEKDLSFYSLFFLVYSIGFLSLYSYTVCTNVRACIHIYYGVLVLGFCFWE